MKADNPFTLTFGKQPAEYISRYENTETIISTFEGENPVSQAYLIEGIRGSGKTVLMTTIANELRKRDEWIIVDLNPTQDLLEQLSLRLSDVCRRFPDLLQTGFNISVAGFGVGTAPAAKENDSVGIIDDILAAMKRKHKRVVISIDEVMHDDNMRRFVSQFQIFIRRDYPLFLLMTGLYENIYSIQNDPALTFLLRTPKIHLEPLSIAQITKQYARIFSIDLDKAGYLAKLTKGYAFAFQALGMLYFEYADTLTMDEIISKLDDMLDDFVYKKIWESLSGQERAVILAMPETDIKVGTLCSALGMSSATFSRYRDRLIKKGIIRSSGHGYVELVLPRFSLIARLYE